MDRTAATALPTEPLLDESGVDSLPSAPDPATRQWLQELSHEPELPARCEKLYAALRKGMGSERVSALGEEILRMATKGEPAGIATLAAFVSVRAPGERLVRRVGRFTSVRRELQLIRRRQRAGNPLASAERELLAEVQAFLAESGPPPPPPSGSGEDPAVTASEVKALQEVFGSLVAELEATETLVSSHLDDFLRLSRFELQAREIRAARLAEGIDPFAARQISRMMPVLGQVDAELHDLRDFVDEVEEQRRAALLLERRPRGHEHLDTPEWQQLRAALGESPRLALLRRIFLGMERSPLPERTLSYYVDRVLVICDRLRELSLRRHPLDVPTAVAHVLDFHRDGLVTFPASARVVQALHSDPPDGVDLLEGRIRLVFDPSAARALSLAHGLPLPLAERKAVSGEPDAEPSVKDLVLDNLNKTSVVLGLLKNEKVVCTPGVVALVVQRCRNLRILEVIANTRKLHSGFANKDVPISLLRSPCNIPMKTLRKFISVRYVGKVDLRRLARDRSSVRREVADEIEAYLKSLH